MKNEDLKIKYNEMHNQGPSSWFGQGEEERDLILKMGEPWKELYVLEIGCGEGDLAAKMSMRYGYITAIDYSETAITKAIDKYEHLPVRFHFRDYHNMTIRYDRIVMQGVLEHLDNPFTELKWMMDNLLTEKGDIITSSPCFLNPRGIVWMTLDMLGAVMSKTDLHYLNPCDFQNFCYDNHYSIEWETCDLSWAYDADMISDLKQRIPLALKDGNIVCEQSKFEKFVEWLDCRLFSTEHGATAAYRIQK